VLESFIRYEASKLLRADGFLVGILEIPVKGI
jgi:hypothetical protein